MTGSMSTAPSALFKVQNLIGILITVLWPLAFSEFLVKTLQRWFCISKIIIRDVFEHSESKGHSVTIFSPSCSPPFLASLSHWPCHSPSLIIYSSVPQTHHSFIQAFLCWLCLLHLYCMVMVEGGGLSLCWHVSLLHCAVKWWKKAEKKGPTGNRERDQKGEEMETGGWREEDGGDMCTILRGVVGGLGRRERGAKWCEER